MVVCMLVYCVIALVVLAVLLICLPLLKSYQTNTRYQLKIAVVCALTLTLVTGFNEGRNKKNF